MDPQKQPTQCGDDFCHRYSCYIDKKEFDDGASLAAHDKIYYCGHCHIQFRYKSSLADHNKETHTNGQDDLVRNSIFRMTSDSELSPFLWEDEGDRVCSSCKMSGHSGASCSGPQIGNVLTKFWEAFPRAKEAYENAVVDIAPMKSALKGWTAVSQPC